MGESFNSNMRDWLDNFLAHRPLLFKIVSRIVRPDEIEDIVQETFLHFYKATRKSHISNPRAFMVTIARNLAFNHNKRAENKLNSSIEDLIDPDVLALTGGVEVQCESDEKFQVFCRAVAELPVSCRKVFILKKVYGLSQKEIANYLDISSSTVEKHVAKGMLKTAEYMIEMGQLSKAKVASKKRLKRNERNQQ